MISSKASRTVLRSVALFEAAKGVLIIVAGFGLLSLLHRDLHQLAVALVRRLHLDPTRHLASAFIEAAEHTTDARLWLIASIGFVSAAFRFTEAYGLWRARAWAEWLALVSGGIYLPLEVYQLWQKFTWIRISALVTNLFVVAAIAWVLWRNKRQAEETIH